MHILWYPTVLYGLLPCVPYGILDVTINKTELWSNFKLIIFALSFQYGVRIIFPESLLVWPGFFSSWKWGQQSQLSRQSKQRTWRMDSGDPTHPLSMTFSSRRHNLTSQPTLEHTSSSIWQDRRLVNVKGLSCMWLKWGNPAGMDRSSFRQSLKRILNAWRGNFGRYATPRLMERHKSAHKIRKLVRQFNHLSVIWGLKQKVITLGSFMRNSSEIDLSVVLTMIIWERCYWETVI